MNRAARHLLTIGLLALAVIGAWIAVPSAVAAHADLVDADPRPASSLLEGPDAIRLEFSEPIDPELAFVDLLDADQQRVGGTGPIVVSAERTEVSVALPDLVPGVYTVSYQVVSAVDGHATVGAFAFVVDPTGTQAPPPEGTDAASPSVDAGAIVARWAGLAGALVALGSLVMWWRSRPVLRRGTWPPWGLIAAAAALGALGVVAYLVVAAGPILEAVPERRGLFPLDPAAPFGWTPFAVAMRLALAGALATVACALFGWRRPSRSPRALPAVAAVAAAGTLAAMSTAAHAAAIGGLAFALVDWAHLLGVAAWLGGMPAVVILARGAAAPGRDARSVAGDVLRRHGATALIAAPIVVLTGIANAPLVVGDTRDLVASSYGNLLLAKVGLLSLALAIGAVNHYALRSGGRVARGALLAVEAGVAVLAIAVAATMVTVQPASARQPEIATPVVGPAHLFGDAGPTRVHATIDPPRPGVQTFAVTVTDATTGGPPDDLQRLFVDLTPPPGAGLPETRLELPGDEHPAGFATTTGAHLAVEGEWTVEVVVRRAGVRDEAATFSVPVVEPPEPQVVPPPDTGIGVPAPIGLAWGLMPPGPLGWLPAAVALAAMIAIGLSSLRHSGVGRVIQVLLAGALLVAVLAAGSRELIHAANTPTPTELAEHRPPADHEASPERGQAIYLANCAACHGMTGDGRGPVVTVPRAGPLADPVARMTSAELSYRIANGLGGTPMPPFAGTLTVVERWDLISYLEDRFR